MTVETESPRGYFLVFSHETGEVIIEEAPSQQDMLKWLQTKVGGYIEIVGCPESDLCIIGNENGQLLQLPINPRVLCYFGTVVVVASRRNRFVGMPLLRALLIKSAMDELQRERLMREIV